MGIFGWSYPPGAASDPFAPYNMEEQLNNSAIAEAFPDHDGPYSLYRSTYKCTDCGPSVGVRIQYWTSEDNGESGPGGTYDREVTKQLYCDDLRKLGTWKDMDERGEFVVAFLVSSIVEGVEQETSTAEVEHKPLDEEPSELAAKYWAAVESINQEANAIWNETHGCETCAKHFGNASQYGECEGNDGCTPVWEDCPDCGGCGAII